MMVFIVVSSTRKRARTVAGNLRHKFSSLEESLGNRQNEDFDCSVFCFPPALFLANDPTKVIWKDCIFD